MRILFLCKRRPQGRDLIERPYGRFHHLPRALAERGHDVLLVLLGHHDLETTEAVVDGLPCIALDVRRLGPFGLRRAIRDAADKLSPDWIVGCSDAWVGWLAHDLAHALARSGKVKLAIDAYDNYEAYMPWNLPLHALWRRAIAAADLVTVAGPQLAQRLGRHRSDRDFPKVLPMSADPAFRPQDRKAARAALGLPVDAPLIGYFGGWAAKRGTRLLADAFAMVRRHAPDARLVLSGNPPDSIRREANVLALGYIDDAKLPTMVNALDVSWVVTADTGFGRYSYPAKLCETMACGVPVVATGTAPVQWMLHDDPRFVVPLGDSAAFVERTLANLKLGRVDYGPLPAWSDTALRLESLLSGTVPAGAA